VFNINIKQLEKGNEYEINGEVAYLEIAKKNGAKIKATVDANELEKVLAKGTWFAQWNKDFNSYIVQTLCELNDNDEKTTEKINLQSFLMNVHTKAPIHFKNGDTLDNRLSNLELYTQNLTNDFKEIDEKTIAIILRDKFGKEIGKALIDKEDFERVMNVGYRWDLHKVNAKPYAVANIPEGRIFLKELIMQTPENEILKAINLNTLDNRKCNLKLLDLTKEREDVGAKRYRK